MSMLFLGCLLLLSFTEGLNKVFTCSPGRLTATCDAEGVILTRRVFRGYYGGTFDGSHCKHQMGDGFETDDRDSKEVWKDCNLRNTCSVPFIQSGNYYLEMHYECDINTPVTLGVAVPLIIVSVIIILWRRKGCNARSCKCHSGENTSDAAQNNVTPAVRPVNENLGADFENVSKSTFVNHAFIGDQNPAVSNIPDIGNSSYVNVPDVIANFKESQNQMMPAYENIGPGRSQGAGTEIHRPEAPAPPGENYSEIGESIPSMPGAGAAGAHGEEDNFYAQLDPVERSEYLDLRHIGFAGTAGAVPGEEAESPYAKLDPVEHSDYLDLRHLAQPEARECNKF